MTQPLQGFGFERTEGACDWWTPAHVFDALGLQFALDPCAPPAPLAPWIPALERYSLPQDGLALPWHGRVWLNPPYGGSIMPWIGRLINHGHGVALTFARTDSNWWLYAAENADLILFFDKRLKFVDGRSGKEKISRNHGVSGSPACLLAYGQDCAEAVAASELGLCAAPKRRHTDQLALSAAPGTVDA